MDKKLSFIAMTSRKKAIGFDLDYTLWDQDFFALTFFEEIAEDVSRRLGLTETDVLAAFNNALLRLTLFHPNLYDEALRHLGVCDPELVAELVSRYHKHRPLLEVYPGAYDLLKYLKSNGYRLFLITDGNSETQRYKVDALKIGHYFEYMVFTGDYPKEMRKPHPFSFIHILEKMEMIPDECVYIGDNPQCDFEGPKSLGIMTIGVLTGPYAQLKVPIKQTPDFQIDQLEMLRQIL